MNIHRLIPDTQSLTEQTVIEPEDRLEFVTLDMLGRSRRQTVSASQLEPSAEPHEPWTPLGHAAPFIVAAGGQSDYFKQLAARLAPLK